jgi:hypothetical protein
MKLVEPRGRAIAAEEVSDALHGPLTKGAAKAEKSSDGDNGGQGLVCPCLGN